VRPFILFSAFLFFSLSAYSEERLELPERTIHRFYTALTRGQPNLHKEFESLSPYLDQKMNMLVKQALAANDSYINRFPDDIPPLEHGNCVFFGGGDCEFSSFKQINLTVKGSAAKGIVELEIIDRNRPKEPPYRWRNDVKLIQEQGKWVITDIDYFGTSASDNLKQIIKDAQ
jgi:hypothetical protein